MLFVGNFSRLPSQLPSNFCSLCCHYFRVFRNLSFPSQSDSRTWYVSLSEEEKQLFYKYENNVLMKRLMRRMGLPVPYKVSTYSMFLRSSDSWKKKHQLRRMKNVEVYRSLESDQLQTLEMEALEEDKKRQQQFFKTLLDAKENYQEMKEPPVAFSAWQSLISSVSNFKVASRVYENLHDDELDALTEKAIQSQDEYMAWMKSLPEKQRFAYLANFLFTLLSGRGIRKTQKLFSHTTSRYSTWHAFLKSEHSLKADRCVSEPGYMNDLLKRNAQIYLNLDEQSKQKLKADVKKRSLGDKPKQ